MTDGYAEAVARARREKDEAYRRDPWSPIPAAERPSFAGLRYYPVDPAYRYRVRLVKHPDPAVVVMQTSDGDRREYLNLGHFEITVQGEPVRLQAYWSEQNPALFIPFRDATSGKETYGAGRYLDLEWEGADAEYTLDLNLAYNPSCAYSDEYSCPFPPPENWLLKVAIRAGEKTYKDE